MVRLEQSSTSLDEVLAQVAKGEPVEVLRGGRPVARVSPLSESNPSQEEIKEAIAGLRRIQERNTLGGISLKSLIDEGRP